MTSYFSLAFLAVFLPLTVLAYSLAPQKARWAVLLSASYGFFWAVSGKLAVFLLASTASVYALGLVLNRLAEAKRRALAAARSAQLPAEADAERTSMQALPQSTQAIKRSYARQMRTVLAAGLAFNIGMLALCKYVPFFGSGLKWMLAPFGINLPPLLPAISAPIGISFYTLMAVSYLVDVYRGSARADRHLGRVALYLAFFPQIMEGPICRYKETAAALCEGRPIQRSNLFAGSLRILWGVAKKIIVADRLNAFVAPVFDDYGSYDGGIIALAAVLYTLQLYCDFSGAMDVALGIGKMFGVPLPENFRQPFFSRTASEFWQRWHITLGTWFRDYVYYPVSLSRPLKRLTTHARKRFGNRYGPLLTGSFALLCVWLGNGLWHGAGSQYVFFGLYYCAIIIAGSLVEPTVQHGAARFGIDRECALYRAAQIARTLVIVFVGELFFRANGLSAGLDMFARMVGDFSTASLLDGTVLAIGMDAHDFMAVGTFALAMLAVGLLRERGVEISKAIARKHAGFRWSAWLALFMGIVIFGAYGTGYTPVDPLYAQF